MVSAGRDDLCVAMFTASPVVAGRFGGGGCRRFSPRALSVARPSLARGLVGGTLCLPQGLDPLRAIKQAGRAGRPDRTAGDYGQRESGRRRVIWCLDHCEHVVFAERVTARDDLAAHGLESRRTASNRSAGSLIWAATDSG